MTLYLNNYGSRWIDTDAKLMKVILAEPNGNLKVRKVDYWYSFGNFAGCSFRYKGKRYNRLPKYQPADSQLDYPLVEIISNGS